MRWGEQMSWIGPAGKKALKYGPQAQLLWKHAAKPATSAAQQAIASIASRRTALKHADTVIEGALLNIFHEGREHWVVFSKGSPVAVYPPLVGGQSDQQLAALTQHADLSKKMTPDQVRARLAEQSKRQQVINVAANLKEQARQRRDGFD
jgi:hypothetical protein